MGLTIGVRIPACVPFEIKNDRIPSHRIRSFIFYKCWAYLPLLNTDHAVKFPRPAYNLYAVATFDAGSLRPDSVINPDATCIELIWNNPTSFVPSPFKPELSRIGLHPDSAFMIAVAICTFQSYCAIKCWKSPHKFGYGNRGFNSEYADLGVSVTATAGSGVEMGVGSVSGVSTATGALFASFAGVFDSTVAIWVFRCVSSGCRDWAYTDDDMNIAMANKMSIKRDFVFIYTVLRGTGGGRMRGNNQYDYSICPDDRAQPHEHDIVLCDSRCDQI